MIVILSRIFRKIYKIKRFQVSSGYMKLDSWNFWARHFSKFTMQQWNFLCNISIFSMLAINFMDKVFSFGAVLCILAIISWKKRSKNASSTESLSFRNVAAKSSAFISWRIISTAGSSDSEDFHSSESIFVPSWKSAKENDFSCRNFLFFPNKGSFGLNVGRYRGQIISNTFIMRGILPTNLENKELLVQAEQKIDLSKLWH